MTAHALCAIWRIHKILFPEPVFLCEIGIYIVFVGTNTQRIRIQVDLQSFETATKSLRIQGTRISVDKAPMRRRQLLPYLTSFQICSGRQVTCLRQVTEIKYRFDVDARALCAFGESNICVTNYLTFVRYYEGKPIFCMRNFYIPRVYYLLWFNNANVYLASGTPSCFNRHNLHIRERCPSKKELLLSVFQQQDTPDHLVCKPCYQIITQYRNRTLSTWKLSSVFGPASIKYEEHYYNYNQVYVPPERPPTYGVLHSKNQPNNRSRIENKPKKRKTTRVCSFIG